MCHMVPTIVGLKTVFTRPHLRDFLHEVSHITARVVVWSSMMLSMTEKVITHLFGGNRPPFHILGQDHYKKIETSPGHFLQVGSKPVFLKVLFERVFELDAEDQSFTADNTLLINDSPEKSVCNEEGSAIFPQSWH